MKFAENLWKTLFDIFFPKVCVGCNKKDVWICKKCRKEIIFQKGSLCAFCKAPAKNDSLCKICKRKYYLDGLISACFFKPPIKEAIYKLKYNKTKDLASVLADLIYNNTKLKEKEFQKKFKKRSGVLMPVPLHPVQKRQRGFNQAELLAEKLSKKTDILIKRNVLKRVKNTKSQSKLNRKERKKNIKGAFEIRKIKKRMEEKKKGENKKDSNIKVKHKKILLVDDVFTTGATLNEAAKTLKKNKAKEVWGITAARA